MSETFPQVVFTAPGKAELLPVPASTLPSDPKAVLIETEFSIVSPGTELACLAGTEAWAPLPFKPGYGAVGRVSHVGADVAGLAVGQRVFTYGNHAKRGPAKRLHVPLPPEADPVRATFARMAAVSITALRVSEAELGDSVAVFGLGPVGNLAAQLFALAGCEVIGIDLSEKRRALARQCGISAVLSPDEVEAGAIASLTGGRMCRTVVEATGVPGVAERAGAAAGKLGELILLGSPRGDHAANLTAFLNRTHLWDQGCVTVKGAHEWRYPILDDPQGHGRHSLERNVRILLKLIGDGRLRVDPLLTHVLSPADCQEAYDGLRGRKDEYLGVVFDWSKI